MQPVIVVSLLTAILLSLDAPRVRLRLVAQRTTPAAWTVPVGIPNPPAGLEPERATPTSASQCPNWPGATSTNCYYVDNTHGNATDTGNPNGYPNLPRLTLPGSVSFTRIEIKGGGSNYSFSTRTWTATGGSGNSPAVVTGLSATCVDRNAGQWTACPIIEAAPAPARTLNFLGTWIIIQGLELDDVRVDNLASGNNLDNVLFRWNYLRDWCPRCDTDTMIAFAQGDSATGNASDYNENIVIYDTEITNIGDMDAAGEIDDIGTNCSNGARNWWVLDNHWWNINGDSVRIGTNVGRGHSPNRGTNCYVGRNLFHHNGENGVDVKNANNSIFSQNIVHTGRQSKAGTSDGPCFAIHERANNTAIVFNECYDTQGGVDASSGNQTNVFIVGNLFRNLRDDDRRDPNVLASNGTAVDLSQLVVDGSATAYYVVDNTFYGNDRDIDVEPSRASAVFTIAGNLHGGTASTGAFIGFRNGSASLSARGATIRRNMFPSGGSAARLQVGSTRYTTLGSARGANGNFCPTGCLEGNAGFTNTASNIFTLLSKSAAVGQNVENEVYDILHGIFGTGFKYDRVGVARPQGGAWDIGAHER